MKSQQKCGECGKPFWVNMIKVFVFKRRFCPIDKTTLNISLDGETYTCPKCNKVILKKDTTSFMSLGISIAGSTRSFFEAEKQRKTGEIEVEPVMVPEKQLCQKCRNYQERYSQAAQKRERKIQSGVSDDIQVIPDTIKDTDIYRYEIMKKTQEDYRTKQTTEMRAKQEKAQKELEMERKAKLVKIVSEKLIDPSQMKPLIDPETQKLIDEEKKKEAEDKKGK
jgi:hypothetical protein